MIRSPMTMSEKALARACGKEAVRAGDLVCPDPELVFVHDGYVETVWKELSGIGYRQITRPERVVFVTDHDVIYTTARAVERGAANRRIAAEWKVGQFFDAGQGGHGHIFPMLEGIVRPGMVIFAYDIHCTNFGAIGAYAMGVGTEISAVLATGTLLTEVPHTIRVKLLGEWRQGLHARDVGFRLSHELSAGIRKFPYEARSVEFTGVVVERMSLAARVGLCNTLTEIGVGNTLFPPIRSEGGENVPDIAGDPDAEYESEVTFDLSALSPQVALPGAPENAIDVQEVVGRKIQHAYIGSCGSSMYEDFADAALLMRGRKLPNGVRMIIVPGSVSVVQRLAADGLIQSFTDAGAIVLPPGCGPCAGGRSSLLGPGEVSISTAATNHAGRMGSATSEAYLASPLTVAASALAGQIVDPRSCQ